MNEDEKKFPTKLYGVRHHNATSGIVTFLSVDQLNVNDEVVGVYRLTHKKKVVIKKNLSLASV